MAESRRIFKAEKTICIYCMGDYGLETYFKLKERGVKIDFFADRDPEKQGYALDNLYCKSYEELLQEDKGNVILIVAIKKPEMLISHFRQQGFQYVYNKELAVQVLADENRKVLEKKECLQNIELIIRLKEDIQKVVYNNGKIRQEEIKDMLQDFQLRHGGTQGKGIA